MLRGYSEINSSWYFAGVLLEKKLGCAVVGAAEQTINSHFNEKWEKPRSKWKESLLLPTYYLERTGCQIALFDMPNLNRFDILSISIFCKIALSISISYRYFSELPYRYGYRYRYFQLLHIDIDIFQKCRYIDNRYFISIF